MSQYNEKEDRGFVIRELKPVKIRSDHLNESTTGNNTGLVT